MDIAQLKDVTVTLPGSSQPSLEHISLTIQEFGHLVITGPNGSGKSTLLALLNGSIWAKSGQIRWACNGVWETSPIMGRSISALVAPAIQENMQRQGWDISVTDLIQGGLNNAPASYAHSLPPCTQTLEMASLLGLTDWLKLNLPELSQGQLRMALIARALMGQPKLLLLDECADGLDKRHKNLLFAALERLANKTTMVFAAHRQDSMPEWCKERLHLEKGQLCPAPRKHHSAPIPAFSKRAAPKPGESLIKLQDASVYVNRVRVLKSITWELKRGEHWLLTGPNGSGKSTFLRLLAGEENIAFGGFLSRWPDPDGLPVLSEVQKRVRLVSDLGQALYGYPLTALELVCSGFDNTIGLWREIKDAEQREAQEMLARFFPDEDMGTFCAASIRKLSTGQLRRIYLARALMGKPDVLLLDEASAGLDGQSRASWLQLLDELTLGGASEKSPSLVFVSHYEEDIPVCINRHARMADGKLEIVW